MESFTPVRVCNGNVLGETINGLYKAELTHPRSWPRI